MYESGDLIMWENHIFASLQYKRVENKLSTRILLSYFLERLSRKRKHLGTYISNTTSKTVQLFYKNYFNKSTIISLLININFFKVRIIVKPSWAII